MRSSRMFGLFAIVFVIIVSAIAIGSLEEDSSAEPIGGTYGNNLTWTLDSDTGELTVSGAGPMYNYGFDKVPWYDVCGEVRSVVIGPGITSIGNNAFSCYTGLTSIEIPSTVTSIGTFAFNGCTGLTTIDISSVRFIDNNAFSGCTGLTSIDLSSVTSIGNYAFQECTALTTIGLSSVTSLGTHAFSGCTGLTSIEISSTITSIGICAFYECTGLTSIEIPSTVTSIGNYAFQECTALTTIDLSSVTSIGNDAFRGCTALTTPDLSSVTSIGSSAFQGCTGLTTLDLSSVTSIGSSAFQECTGLTSIEIPSTLTSIGDSVFMGCTALTTIDISSVTSIGSKAFQDCTSLRSITIHSGITSIGYEAFYNCKFEIAKVYSDIALNAIPKKYLKEIVIGEGVTSIGEYAFAGSVSLTSVTIPSTLVSIGKYAFYESNIEVAKINSDLVLNAISNPSLKTVELGESVTFIDNKAFQDCISLESITIPSTVTSIGNSAFQGCTLLASVTIPSSVAHISKSAFQGCTSLQSVTMLSGVTAIFESAFSGCTSLTNIEMPSTMRSFAKNAFQDCTSLESVTIPLGVTDIASDAFSGCIMIKSIVLPSSLTYLDRDAFSGCKIENVEVHSNVAMTAVRSFLKTIVIGEGVTSIERSAFFGSKSLESVTIASTVTQIGDSAFSGCRALTSVVMSSGITSIGNGAFFRCTSLTSIEIAPTVTSIGNSAFNDCTSLTSVVMSSGIISIGDSAFNGCKALRSAAIPSTVETIGSSAFYDCKSLASVTIPSGVTSIERFTFSGCASIKSITIPSTVTSIGSSAFSGCKFENMEVYSDIALKAIPKWSLKTAVIGEGVTSIGEDTFRSCVSLISVMLPSTLRSIGHSAFYECESLVSVSMQPGVTSIDSWAFKDCISLRSVTIPSTVETIGHSAFNNCTSLTSVAILSNVTTIDDGAFEACTSMTEINVALSNPNYSSDGGVLFNKNKTTLITYPAGKEGAYTIPSSVTSIGSSAFQGCPFVTSVTIPSSVTSLGGWTFSGCASLTEINVASNNSSYSSKDGVLFDKNKNTLITYPAGKAGAYSIPSGVIWVYGSFPGCTLLTSVTIPSSVTSISSNTFSDCVQLTEINVATNNSNYSSYDGVLFNKNKTTLIVYPAGKGGAYSIPSTVTTVGDNAFSNCILTSIIIPSTVKSINYGAFWGAKAEFAEVHSNMALDAIPKEHLNTILIGEGVTEAGGYDFSECVHLTDITVAADNPHLTSIDGVLFNKDQTTLIAYPAKKQGAYSIPSSVTTIDGGAFFACTALTSVSIPSTVTSATSSVFYGCTSLKHIEISSDILASDNSMLAGCTSLESLTISSGVTAIGNNAFYGSTSLVSVIISSTVTSIGSSAFQDCTSLESITIPSTVRSIGDSAFSGCTGLTVITIGNVGSIGDYAFELGTESERVTCTVYAESEGILDEFGNEYTTFTYVSSSLDPFTVTFELVNAPSGTVTPESSEQYAGQLVSISDLSIEYYTMRISVNGTALSDMSFTMPAEDVMIKIMYFAEDITRTLTFIVDGIVFDTIQVKDGGAPILPKGVPEKGSTAEFEYTFVEWEGLFDVMFITEDMQFIAVFSEKTREYEISFLSDGVIVKIGILEYGTTITRPLQDPVKASTVQYDYEFTGWNGFTEGMVVTDEAMFIANFTQSLRMYTITFNGYPEAIESHVGYGSAITVPLTNPVKASTSTMDYKFSHWIGYVTGMTVAGDATFEPMFKGVLKVDTDDLEQITENDKIKVDDNSSDEIEISAEIINAIDSDVSSTETVTDGLSVSTRNGTIELDQKTISSLNEQATSGISISITPVVKSTLSTMMQNVVKDRPVYDVKIGDVSTFGGGVLKVSLKYTLQDGEDESNIVVWCVNTDGTIERFVCTYSEGYVTFETTHLSYYCIAYEAASPGDDGEGDGMQMMHLIIGAVAVLVVIIVAVLIMRRN